MNKITFGAISIFAGTLIIIFVGAFMFGVDNPQTGTSAKTINTKDYINTAQPTANPVGVIKSPNINMKLLVADVKKQQRYSFQTSEVAKHNTRNDCYLIINGNVYNVSSYISYHPGGSSIITSRCGKEVTGIFASIHSNRAWDLLKKYKIGTVGTNKSVPTGQVLNTLSDALAKANPTAEIVNVRPKQGFYIAKIIYNGKLYEVHINNKGRITKEEVANDELNWSLWQNDNDDK